MAKKKIKLEVGQRWVYDPNDPKLDSVIKSLDPLVSNDGGPAGLSMEWDGETHFRGLHRFGLREAAPVAPALTPNPKQAYGAHKPDLSLIPPVAMHHAAIAMEHGAAKYGPFNWRDNAVEARTYIAAIGRHLLDFADRTDFAADSGVHNLGAVIANAAILLDAIEQGNLIDNRPPAGKSAEVLDRLQAWKRERAEAK